MIESLYLEAREKAIEQLETELKLAEKYQELVILQKMKVKYGRG